jgi:hypothetical protein
LEVKLTLKNEKMCVLDEVFSEDHFQKVWDYTQKETYSMPHSGSWIKVWRLSDSIPMGGPEYQLSKKPFHNEMDLVLAYILEIAKHCEEYLGEWDEIVMRSYLYPRGTKLSWHDDGIYSGAIVLYTHPKWGATWGGELMIAETEAGAEIRSPHLDKTHENELLGRFGVGTYVSAKPNRAIVTRKNVWHQINRVDLDAGDNIRSSIVCFFKKTT